MIIISTIMTCHGSVIFRKDVKNKSYDFRKTTLAKFGTLQEIEA